MGGRGRWKRSFDFPILLGIIAFDIVHQLIIANRFLYTMTEQQRETMALLRAVNESTRRVEHVLWALKAKMVDSTDEEEPL